MAASTMGRADAGAIQSEELAPDKPAQLQRRCGGKSARAARKRTNVEMAFLSGRHGDNQLEVLPVELDVQTLAELTVPCGSTR